VIVTDRQTDGYIDHGTVTLVTAGKIACRQCRLKSVLFIVLYIVFNLGKNLADDNVML